RSTRLHRKPGQAPRIHRPYRDLAVVLMRSRPDRAITRLRLPPRSAVRLRLLLRFAVLRRLLLRAVLFPFPATLAVVAEVVVAVADTQSPGRIANQLSS